MPAHAGVHIHVSCSSKDRGEAGLDSDMRANLYLSWVEEGEDPRDPNSHEHIEVLVVGADENLNGVGDDAVTIAEAVAQALHEMGDRAPTHRVGSSKIIKPGTRRKPRDEVDTHAYVEFDDVESIDCGICDDKGKVRIDFYGNVPNRKPMTTSLRGVKPGDPVEVIPVRLAFEPKGPCPTQREPLDPNPGPLRKVPPATTVAAVPPPHPADLLKDPVPPLPPPVTPPPPPPPHPVDVPGHPSLYDPGHPPTPPHPVDVPGHPSLYDPVPPPLTPLPPYTPPPIADPWREGPYIVAPVRAGGGPGGRAPSGDTAFGVFHLAFGSALGAEDVTWLYVPWRVVRTNPHEQLLHIAECLESAGVECYLEGVALLIIRDWRTLRPVCAFRVTISYAGRGFPWISTVDLWQERPAGSLPTEYPLDQHGSWSVERQTMAVSHRDVHAKPTQEYIHSVLAPSHSDGTGGLATSRDAPESGRIVGPGDGPTITGPAPSGLPVDTRGDA